MRGAGESYNLVYVPGGGGYAVFLYTNTKIERSRLNAIANYTILRLKLRLFGSFGGD
ncbi:MAG: hypothetical protein SAJ12_07190 [Jaaginema sp. PMC 1079.18]|nr:hypothetical protein [Jaaginema sp. PMC 1080.18]MEC4850781.1 hypothetical protein [Jaaginema sp. PMC 1079.18]MEC4865938.1 hypothetical protein [Jaaginema sp. PMC 1078.18]